MTVAKALVYLKQMEKLESGTDIKRLAHHVIEALEDLEGRLKALEKRQAVEDGKARR